MRVGIPVWGGRAGCEAGTSSGSVTGMVAACGAAVRVGAIAELW